MPIEIDSSEILLPSFSLSPSAWTIPMAGFLGTLGVFIFNSVSLLKAQNTFVCVKGAENRTISAKHGQGAGILCIV